MGSETVQMSDVDRFACEGNSHVAVATRLVADLMTLDTLGRWPDGQRNRWVVWSLEHGADLETISRVLNVTRERIRQIHNQVLRERSR